MKTSWFPIVLLALVAMAVSITLGQPERKRSTKEFMNDKLGLSQGILRGLALEQFDLITANALKLSAMSKEADWRVFQNPDYEQHSLIFRRHADSLARTAKDKDLDGATLAYLRMTLSCVDCHKLVRGKLVATVEHSREWYGELVQ